MTAEQCIKQNKLETWYAEYPNDSYNGEMVISTQDCRLAMVEFAKFHVKAALEAASKLDFEDITHPEANDYQEAVQLTIKECYSLENIK